MTSCATTANCRIRPPISHVRWDRSEAFVTRVTGGHDFDCIYDTVGGKTLDDAFASVRRFGHVVSALEWGAHALAPLSLQEATYSGIFTLLPLLTGEGRAHHGEILAEATRLAEAGQLQPSLDPRRFTLDSIEEAYRLISEGGAHGKLFIDIEPEAKS